MPYDLMSTQNESRCVMGIEDLIASLRAADSLEMIPGLADQITEAYGGLTSGYEANTAGLNEQIASLQAELQKTQADNYRLMVALGQNASDNGPAEEPATPIDDFSDVIEVEKED